MPVIAQKLLSLETSTEEGQRQMLSLIEQDPQILARIIGLANSPVFGTSRRITSVSEAIIVLGINKIKTVSSGIAIMSIKSTSSSETHKLHDLWMHNLGIAFAMISIGKAMPKQLRPQDDQIFLAGMLHDIGYLALAHLDQSLSHELHTYLAASPNRPALDIERSLMDVTHDELGAELARHWNLPNEIISVIRYHHSPDASDVPKNNPLIRMVHIAEKMLPSFGVSEHVGSGIPDSDWLALGIEPANAEEIINQAAEQADQAALFAANLG